MLKLRVEKSQSRSGKHAFRSFYIVMDSKCNKVEVKPKSMKVIKPLYMKGEAYEHEVLIPEGYFAIELRFVKCLRGRVKGEIIVYDSKGGTLCRAVYRKLKIRFLGCMDKSVVNIITCVVSQLKIPVKKYAVIRI
ncbi:MAG: hypothetical protein QXH99_01380 [Sulfolobales archaeon]|jgi:hypothetical protein|nr:hypothetical protein [Desulfurococcaceae archaeon]